jgi:hypothetical protein
VAIEDAQEALDIVLGTFLANSNTTIMLFDSGALHSFISTEYVAKYNLPVSLLKYSMVVSSPSGDMPARQVCPRVHIKRRGVDFIAYLIIIVTPTFYKNKNFMQIGVHVKMHIKL